MNAYFTASIVGKRQYGQNYRKIIDYITSKGITVASAHIMDTTEDQIRMESKKEREQFQKTLEGWITSCDFMVVEASFPSISVGYEIALALHRAKPILVLYTDEPPSLIMNSDEDKLVVEQYTLSSFTESIDEFLNYMRGANDTRFTFFITPEINAYLAKVSKKDKLPKSVYLRNLIASDMAKRQ
jgi:hypothetical protein